AELAVEHDGTGVSTPYTFRVDLWNEEGERVAYRRISSSGHGHPLGTLAEPGTHQVDLVLETGIAVEWEFRLRGQLPLTDPGCQQGVVINEVEANPPGRDAGNEWLELHNPASWQVNLTGWEVTTVGGREERLVLPGGTSLAPDGHIVIAFPEGQFLDNKAEEIVLWDALGNEMARVSDLSDTANDARTNQRLPDGQGTFSLAPATPGEPNTR
ncbi:MAG: lamin tail domain-containing protein, partial [Candidatus Thermoplasmatota archaeon]|nr:lamin tail domain-containing protein [Candidatus Thermoplasmatota archaeon]